MTDEEEVLFFPRCRDYSCMSSAREGAIFLDDIATKLISLIGRDEILYRLICFLERRHHIILDRPDSIISVFTII